MGKVKNHYDPGQQIGHFILLSAVERRNPSKRHPNGYPQIIWLCKCECCAIAELTKHDLIHARLGNKRSCGCVSENIKKQIYENRYASALTAYVRYYRGLAKRRDISFNLTRDQVGILMQQNCHYCRIQPQNDLKYKMHKNSMKNHVDHKVIGLDRVDSNKDYDLDNVVPCCWICNRAKGNETYDNFIKWIQRITNE